MKKLNKCICVLTSSKERKGNETQYISNTTVKKHNDTTRKELGKMNPMEEHEKAIVKKTGELLKEGMKVIKVRQKYIKIAVQSKLG